VIRRALVHYREHLSGPSSEVQQRRVRSLARLRKLFEGHDAAAEIRRLKREDEHF
jgi:hypothetical protein